MKRSFVEAIGLVVVAALVAGCVAHGHAYRGKDHGWRGKTGSYSKAGEPSLEQKFFGKAHKLLGYREALGLSDEQVNTIETLKLETKKTIIQQDADIEVLALEIKAALHADQADAQNVKQLIDKKYALKGEKAKTLASAYLELKGVLTSDQKEQLKALYQDQGHGAKMCPMSKKGAKKDCPVCPHS